MYIELNKKDKRPLWLQIVDQVIEYITNGQLSPGDTLVPTKTALPGVINLKIECPNCL